MNPALRKFKLTILSFGGGQDSAALFQLFLDSADFRERYTSEHFIVVMSDPGDEHPETYDYVAKVRLICASRGIEFHFLTKDKGYHKPSWLGLMEGQQRSYQLGVNSIVQLGTKSCTINLKLDPIYKFVDEWINTKFGYGFKVNPKTRGCGKDAIKKFHAEHGKIRVLIGFAKGEESRAAKSMKREAVDNTLTNSDGSPIWQAALHREFPLIDLRMGRLECQEYLSKHGAICPPPSNCMRCPYMSKQEMVWLYKRYPEKFEEWCVLEEGKLARFAHLVGTRNAAGKPFKNNGVLNTKRTLRETLQIALEEYKHWTTEQLEEFKFSHGHCVKSAY